MTTVRDPNVQDAAAELRAAMVRELRELNAFASERVATAVATVPRHLFAPGEPLEAAYAADNPVTVKRDSGGVAMSSLSAAHLQAVMLGQAEIEPGMRVLEIGSGGYNAALIQEIVGDGGKVVSVDIDVEIVERARACLEAAGYQAVEVVLADADNGVPEKAPYDRIVVTAGAWDIPPAWVDQLGERGRLVVPLRIKGLTRSIAFDRDGEDLVSRSYGLCSFVPMQGSGSHSERLVPIDEGVALRVDDDSQGFDIEALRGALASPRLERWSGAPYDLPDELELFLLTSGPQMALLHASDALIEQGLFAPSAARGVPALISGGSLAYRTRRPNEDTGGFESGVIAHGPEAETVAARYVDLLRRWASDHRRRGAARIRYTPKGADAAATGWAPHAAVSKPNGAVAITWS
jgi:protein-L-isoaspartate(D-aspartate) O-methyltransferase